MREASHLFAFSFLTWSCVGGQSGTDQFDVERARPSGAEDAGSADVRPDDAGSADVQPDDAGDETPQPLPEIEQLCDGTDRIRFSSNSGAAGPSPAAYNNPFLSARFLVIDGNCRYWLNDTGVSGLRSGVISSGQATALSEALHYGQYAALSAYESPQCPDGGGWRLTDSQDTLVCRCGGCSSGSEPPEFAEAFAAVSELQLDLSARAEWAWGPTSVLPLVSSGNEFSLPWTLDVILADVAIENPLLGIAEDDGVLIDDPDQLDLLVGLRLETLARGRTSQLLVNDADGNEYALFVRDEAPEAINEALLADAHE